MYAKRRIDTIRKMKFKMTVDAIELQKKNNPIWFNFIDIGNIDYLLEMIMSNGIRTAYVFSYDGKKVFEKLLISG